METERQRREGCEQGDGLYRSLYYSCRPTLPGNRVERDARLLGNPRDAKH